MYDIYDWLYNNYAVPRLEPLDEGHLMENIRMDWGTEAFTLGVRFGLDIAMPRDLRLDPDALLQFLPQLDQPVS